MNYDLEELAQTLFEESGDALYLFDPENEQLIEVNPMAQRLGGCTRQEYLRLPISNLFRADAQGGMARLRQAFHKTGLFHSQEGFFLRTAQDGIWIPVNLTITRLHTRQRTLGLVTARDVREQRAVYQQLQKTEAEMRRLLASLSAFVMSLERDAGGRWNMRYLSPVVESITGYPPEYYYGGRENWYRLVVPEDLPLLEDFVRRIDTEPRNLQAAEYRILRADGRLCWVHVSLQLQRDSGGKVHWLTGLVSDITERKEAEIARHASEAKYRVLIENLEQSVFLKDEQGRFVLVNKPFCQILGRTEAEIVGKTDSDFYPPELADKYRADDLSVLREGKRLEVEEQTLKLGKPRTVRTIKTPVPNGNGHNTGVLGIFWDVTQQRALEAQLRQAQKMEAIGQLAGGIAHDFNNLLTAVLGNLSLLGAKLPRLDPNHEFLEAANQAARRAADLTSQLLGFSRRSLFQSSPTDLRGVMTEVVTILRRTIDPRIILDLQSPKNLWLVQSDPAQMTQVLMNLCLNARDAMPEGGRLILESENTLVDEEYARQHVEAREGEYVRLSVRDSGQGMSPELRLRIFEPFFTTKAPGKGTGLGLAMVFGIVKQHQGWIDCQSEVGKGTAFDIYLPRSLQEAPLSSTVTKPAAMQYGHETILLVDDEPMIRNLGRTILQRYGYEVILAEDGQHAVEVYTEARQRIDLVILDLTMPRLSGCDAFRQMRLLNPEVRVLFASGYSAEHISEAESEWILGFVNKPYRPEELVELVRKALDQPCKPLNYAL